MPAHQGAQGGGHRPLLGQLDELRGRSEQAPLARRKLPEYVGHPAFGIEVQRVAVVGGGYKPTPAPPGRVLDPAWRGRHSAGGQVGNGWCGGGAGLAGPAKRCARKAVTALPTTVPTATVPTLCGLRAMFAAGTVGKESSGEAGDSAARLVLLVGEGLRARQARVVQALLQ